MALSYRARNGILGKALRSGVAICALSIFAATSQAAEDSPLSPNVASNSKLYLSSNTLIYDRDHQKIMVSGEVKINYAGYKLVAKKVTYDQATGRLIAEGNIELVEPMGNKVYADKMDITDDFVKGFVNALRIETTDDTHFAAESGQKVDADVFILHNGVYTACRPCAAHPEKAPLWQVKATKIVEDGKSHTIVMQHARFEFLGIPIAYVPIIEAPDHTVKRKSGFLFPTFTAAQNLGFGATVPYYYVFSPSLDATLNTSYYSTQGLLLDAEVRKRFDNGSVSFHVAGINQQKPSAFTAGTSDSLVKKRGLIETAGNFAINSHWQFGWNLLLQSDNNFGRTYQIPGASGLVFTNQIYLTGIGKRNFFDLRSFYFDEQDADPNNAAEFKDAFVHPVLDYHYVAPRSFGGGELSADVNFTNLTHRAFDVYALGTTNRFKAVRGEVSRVTAEAEWKRQFTTPFGLQLTPIAAVRGDAYQLGMQSPSNSGYTYAGSFYGGRSANRGMVTAGLEARYPFLITTPGSQHVFEPIAQIYVRPDEQLAGRLPNEDAQSFVFDATNLFSRNKFSGYDRVEGGTRANIGFRYTGTFDNGYAVNGIFGESFQVAGRNSFAATDMVYAGANSGLDKRASDYVGLLGLRTPSGISLTESWRLTRENWQLAKLDSSVYIPSTYIDTSLTYSRQTAQPAYGNTVGTDELIAKATLKVVDYWKLYGGITWDLNNSLMNAGMFGISYSDECTTFSLGFSQTRDSANQVASDWAIGARLSFRTLGDVKIGDATASSF